MNGLRDKYRVGFVGGPWEGRCGTMTVTPPPSLDAREPFPTEIPRPGERMDDVYVWRGTVYERHVDVDALVAGRELDELVQARVMGAGHGPAPHYSASLTASADLEKRLKKLGWNRVDGGSRPGPASTLPLQLRDKDGRTVEATGRGFEEALCKAALKAVEP